MFKPSYFITGGQNGADSIPFSIYKELGIGLHGYMPSGFKRDSGDGKTVAQNYGLWEGEGSYKWRDVANVSLSDACIAFLSSAPLTGRGTMSTINVFLTGEYSLNDYVKKMLSNITVNDIDCDNLSYCIIEPRKKSKKKSKLDPLTNGFLYSFENPKYDPSNSIVPGFRPVLVFWNLNIYNEKELEGASEVLRSFCNEYKPQNLMFSGAKEETLPGIEENGARLLQKAFS
eukprot:Awhi_evm1s11457